MTVLASTIRGNTSGPAGSGGAGGVADAGGAGGTGGDAAGGGGLSVAEGSMQIANSTFASNTTGDGGTGGAGGPGTTTGGGGGRGGPGGGGGGVLATNPIAGLLQGVTAVGNAAGTGGSGGQGGAGTAAGAAGATGAAGAGGAVLGFAAATAIQDSILASNGATNCAGSIQDAGHNLTFSGAGCPATFLTGDPNLGPLEDNGGPAATVSLGPGSAALDKVPARGAGCQPTDERGVARPSGPACDIGAYELAPPKATSGVAGPIGITTATLNGTVIPNARDATVQFVYGTTTKYGSKSAVQHVSGVIAVPVVAKLTRLKAKVTYHYRIVVTSSDGVGTSVDRTFRTSPAPVITALKIKPSAFRAGGKPATITYSDTLPASVTFVVLTRRGKRLVSVGRFRHTDKVGANTVTFTGRVGGRKLQRGSYRLQATPRANRLNGKQVSLTFRITG